MSIALTCALLVAIAFIETRWAPGTDSSMRELYLFQRGAFLQLGLLGLFGTGAIGLLRICGVSWRPSPRKLGRLAAYISLSAVALFVILEVWLRIQYPDGASFSTNVGPMVQRFSRDFVLNRYDGPSRGPEISESASREGVRILVQGDSITWGQGVKPEEYLFTSRLLSKLRTHDARSQMAVLSKPGREIDGHIEQLRKWGHKIQPNLIIYQWAINDVEIDNAERPSKALLWRRAFFHNALLKRSYFYSLLDFRLQTVLPEPSPTYSEYLLTQYAEGTPGWQTFEAAFRTWVLEARDLTPHVLVALYPDNHGAGHLAQQVRDLCSRLDVPTVSLADAFRATNAPQQLFWASPFDSHPNAEAHRLVAELLYRRTAKLWPEILATSAMHTSTQTPH